MIVKGRFSLDTNVLVYAVDRDAGKHHEQSKELIGHAAQCDCVLTTQVLAEFFHVTTRKKLLEPSHASAFVHDWLEVFQVFSADYTALVNAMDAVNDHWLSFWDAMLWATALQSGCSAILSEDMQDGRRLNGVEFINPFSAEAAIRLATLLKV